MQENRFIRFLIAMVIILFIIYLVCSFVAWDYNPLHWWLFTHSLGRFVTLIIFIIALAGSIKFAYGDNV